MEHIPTPLYIREGSLLLTGTGANIELICTVHGLDYNQRADRAAEIAQSINSHDALVAALERQLALYNRMMAKVPHGKINWNGDDIREMNEAPGQSKAALKLSREKS